MCGRYTITIDKSTIERRFGGRFYIAQAEYEPTYNAAPSQMLPIIRTYSITWSARAIRVGGTVIPSALAVLMFTTSSYLAGTWTGRSAGFAPFRIRST
jgi:hypothetical protein